MFNLNIQINKIDSILQKKLKKKEFKYLLFVLFIIPFALFYTPLNNSLKNIKKTKKEIQNINNNIQNTGMEINTLKVINNNLEKNIQNELNKEKKLIEIEKKLINIRSKLKFFKLKDEEWINILNTLTNDIYSNSYSINSIEIYINNKNNKIVKENKLSKLGIKFDKIKNTNKISDELLTKIKEINIKLNKNLKLLKPKFYIYLNISGNNFYNFMNIIKSIENTEKIKIIWNIKVNKINKNKQNYSMLIIFMTIK